MTRGSFQKRTRTPTAELEKDREEKRGDSKGALRVEAMEGQQLSDGRWNNCSRGILVKKGWMWQEGKHHAKVCSGTWRCPFTRTYLQNLTSKPAQPSLHSTNTLSTHHSNCVLIVVLALPPPLLSPSWCLFNPISFLISLCFRADLFLLGSRLHSAVLDSLSSYHSPQKHEDKLHYCCHPAPPPSALPSNTPRSHILYIHSMSEQLLLSPREKDVFSPCPQRVERGEREAKMLLMAQDDQSENRRIFKLQLLPGTLKINDWLDV